MSHNTLDQMHKENRQTSYERCVVEGRSPQIYFAPEKSTPLYEGYYSCDVDNTRYDFRLGISKGF